MTLEMCAERRRHFIEDCEAELGEVCGREVILDDISDVIRMINSLFGVGTRITCEDAGDTNDDGQMDISDPISLLGFLFRGTIAPPAPFPDSGQDPTADGLLCLPRA